MRLEISNDSDRVRVIRHLVGAGYTVYLGGGLEALDRWDLGDIPLAAERAGADVVICQELGSPSSVPRGLLGAELDTSVGVALDCPTEQTSEDAEVLLAEVGWVMRRPVRAPAGALRSRTPFNEPQPLHISA
jgi:hypothetical protein